MKTHIPKFLICCLFCLLSGVPLHAQQMIVNPMPFLDKLPVNSIFNLYQDRQGFFWLGTAYGLERYDGYDIQPFINNYKILINLPTTISGVSPKTIITYG